MEKLILEQKYVHIPWTSEIPVFTKFATVVVNVDEYIELVSVARCEDRRGQVRLWI